MTKIQSGLDQVDAALAVPSGEGKFPTVVVLQEWWGLNDHIRSVVARWAEAGFIAIAPDLYRGIATKDPAVAKQLMTGLPRERAIADIAAAVEHVRRHAQSTGKVVVSGFCMGGALSLRAACEVRGLSAVIPFYGVPGPAAWENVEAAVMLHVANSDEWVTPAMGAELEATLTKHGKSCTVHYYDADHAFFNDTRPTVYQVEDATLAWERTVAFARRHTS